MLQAEDLQGRRRGPLDDPFELFFGSSRSSSHAFGMQSDLGWRPATDVYETEDELVIQMDLAGMERERIEVYAEDDLISVKGERANIAPPGKKHFHKMEIQIGPFERHIRVPESVDISTAKASYRSGFLFIRLRKGKSHPTPRRSITIQD